MESQGKGKRRELLLQMRFDEGRMAPDMLMAPMANILAVANAELLLATFRSELQKQPHIRRHQHAWRHPAFVEAHLQQQLPPLPLPLRLHLLLTPCTHLAVLNAVRSYLVEVPARGRDKFWNQGISSEPGFPRERCSFAWEDSYLRTLYVH